MGVPLPWVGPYDVRAPNAPSDFCLLLLPAPPGMNETITYGKLIGARGSTHRLAKRMQQKAPMSASAFAE